MICKIQIPFYFKVISTTLTYATVEDQPEGRYHATVVAYNHALEPSKPVCSSGVVVDLSPPMVSDIHVQNTLTTDGLLLDEDGELWYVTRDTFRCQLVNESELCRQGNFLFYCKPAPLNLPALYFANL